MAVPDFIALEALHFQTAHIVVVECSGGATQIAEQVQSGVLRHASHATSGVDRNALYESGYGSNALWRA